MIRMFWRAVVAPRLAYRLAPRVADLLSQDKAFLAGLVSGDTAGGRPLSTEQPPAPKPDQIDSLQIFKGYDDDDLQIFDAFKINGLRPEEGFLTDFLGGRTRVSTLYNSVKPLGGQVHGYPIPGDFHAEAAEWLGVMKTTLTARDRYVAMEWGAGWAPWLIAGAKAAQHLGVTDLRLYGIEADPAHFHAMYQHFVDNGLEPASHVLLQAAVGVEAGSAQWPDEPDALNQWGARPIRDGSEADVGYLAGRVDRFFAVDILEARDLVLREAEWDMVHIDIQGWEGEVCRSCIDLLSERVKWVVIGVHSRVMDAELLEMFHAAGWVLEHEKPTRFRFDPAKTNFEAMVTADGIQVWRNPRMVDSPAVV